MVNCWFGLLVLDLIMVPPNNSPFHKGILGFQTNNPNLSRVVNYLQFWGNISCSVWVNNTMTTVTYPLRNKGNQWLISPWEGLFFCGGHWRGDGLTSHYKCPVYACFNVSHYGDGENYVSFFIIIIIIIIITINDIIIYTYHHSMFSCLICTFTLFGRWFSIIESTRSDMPYSLRNIHSGKLT